MSEYYVGAFSFSDYNAISHGRPKGSRNGYTTMPNYTPIGQRARGKYDPRTGHYIYDKEGMGQKNKPKNYMLRSKVAGANRQIAGAYNKASSAVRTAYGNASRAASGAYGNASRAVSGAYGRASSAARTAYGNASRAVSSGYSNARRAAGDAYRQGREFLTGSNSRIGMERSRDERSFERARQQYEKTLPGRIERFGRNASKFASDSYSKVKNWISTAGSKASKAISSARTTLRKYGSMAVSSIKTAASSTAGKVKNFLSGLFKKKKKSTGTLKVVGTGGRVGTTYGPHKRWD